MPGWTYFLENCSGSGSEKPLHHHFAAKLTGNVGKHCPLLEFAHGNQHGLNHAGRRRNDEFRRNGVQQLFAVFGRCRKRFAVEIKSGNNWRLVRASACKSLQVFRQRHGCFPLGRAGRPCSARGRSQAFRVAASNYLTSISQSVGAERKIFPPAQGVCAMPDEIDGRRLLPCWWLPRMCQEQLRESNGKTWEKKRSSIKVGCIGQEHRRT